MTADATLPASDDLTPEVLARWEELAANATEGPWSFRAGTPWGDEFEGNRPGDVMTDTRPPSTGIPFDPQQFGSPSIAQVQYQDRDGEFIAAARTAVPALLSRVAELEAEVATLRQQRHDALEAVAARDAVIAGAPHAPWCRSRTPAHYSAKLPCTCWKSAAPPSVLTARDAEKWGEGFNACASGGSLRNPYRTGADQ